MTILTLCLFLINLFVSGILKIFLRKIKFESILYFCSLSIMIIIAIRSSFLFLDRLKEIGEIRTLSEEIWWYGYFDYKLKSPFLSDNEIEWLCLQRDFWWLLGPLYLIALFFLIKFLHKFLFSLKKYF
jgi:hypothetical protein